MQTTLDVTNKEQGFFEQPLKIILVVGLSLALLITSLVEVGRCCKNYHSLSVTNQA